MDDRDFQRDVLREFRKLKGRAEAAISQIGSEDFFKAPHADSNSIALIVKHLAGNMKSRWRDFLDTDGEKPDRRRDEEFIRHPEDTRETLMQSWEEGWRLLFETVSSLEPSDLSNRVLIRRESHTVVQAVIRELVHYSGHVGQMIFLAKSLAGDDWNSLTIPRGKSREFEVKPYLSEE